MLLGNACTVGTIFISFCRQHVTATDLHMLVPGCAGTRTSCMTAPSSRRACITRSSTSPGQALQDCITRSSTSPGQAHQGTSPCRAHLVKNIITRSSTSRLHEDRLPQRCQQNCASAPQSEGPQRAGKSEGHSCRMYAVCMQYACRMDAVYPFRLHHVERMVVIRAGWMPDGCRMEDDRMAAIYGGHRCRMVLDGCCMGG